MYIYKITNQINKKIYVGKSIFNSNETEYYFGSGNLINSAINKYGIINFSKEILQENITSVKELNEQEKFWIKEEKSHISFGGYNLTEGGDGGDTISHHPEKERIAKNYSEWNKCYWTEEKRKKRSEKYTGKGNPFNEKTHTTKTKEQISLSKTGISNATETNIKISNTLKKKYETGEIVKIVSDKTRQNIAKSHIGLNHTEKTKEKIKNSLSGEKNHSAKTWIFINENGDECIIKGGFEKFCNEHNLSHKIMRNIADNIRKEKFYNSWTVKKTINENN